MSEIGKLREGILLKVKAEADQIVKEAEEKALEEMKKATQQRGVKFEEEKRKAVEEAESEAARILAQASIKGRQELLKVKVEEIIKGIVDQAKTALVETSPDKNSLLKLIKEAAAQLEADQVRIHVSPKDMSMVKQLVKDDKDLAQKIKEFKETNSSGGVIVESIDGKISIDNTYDTRLDMLLPQILPEIGKELFKDI